MWRGDVKVVHTSRGDLRTFGILVATGASPRKLGFEGESEYAGRGVAYCATCDGEFFTGREVLVIGGGFAAAEEAVFLTKYASKVTILVREDDFTCDASVAAEAKDNPKIEVRYHTVLDGVTAGQGGLTEADDPRRGVRGRRDVAAVRGRHIRRLRIRRLRARHRFGARRRRT